MPLLVIADMYTNNINTCNCARLLHVVTTSTRNRDIEYCAITRSNTDDSEMTDITRSNSSSSCIIVNDDESINNKIDKIQVCVYQVSISMNNLYRLIAAMTS
jgi:hypothetical protein